MSSLKLFNVCLVLGCILALAAAQPWTNPRACPSNEVYLACGPSCQTECATLGQPCMINHFRCPDDCYCIKGHARNGQGKCIPISRCNA